MAKNRPRTSLFDPHQNFFNFFYHHRNGKDVADIACVERLFPTCLARAPWLFEWTHLVFLAHAKNGFSPKTTSQLLSYGSADVSTDPLAHSVGELWPFIALRATIVAFASLKGF